MSFEENVEVLPPNFGGPQTDQNQVKEAKALQKQKWIVLTSVFTLVMVIGLGWVWSRPAIYQSQAIIHFSYAQPLSNEQTAVPEEQISLNEKRLSSNRILENLSSELNTELGVELSTEQLANMISTDSKLASRIINLYTTGENPDLLQPVLSQWLDLYLRLLEEETQVNTADDIQLAKEKLIALEEKIVEQRALVEQYSEDNNIISLERDENRTLAKIKSMGSALDQAETQQAEAQAALNSVTIAIQKGQQVIHPGDKLALDDMRKAIKDGESYLASLAQRYTEEYMNLDPDVVNRKRNLENLIGRYEERLKDSQQRYVEDLNRTLVASKEKQKQLEAQLDQLGRDAQQFNQKLDEYARQTRSLEQLQRQAQQLKDQIVEKEVQKPFQAKINVLEAPFVPTYPISPLYWRDSAIVAGVAVLAALFALLLFSFIHRSKQPAASVTSYTVVPPSGLTLEHQMRQQQMLAQQHQAALGNSATTPVAALESHVTPRLLTQAECQALYQVANRDGKVALTLIMHGVTVQESLALTYEQIDVQNCQITIQGALPRTVALSDHAVELFTPMVAQGQPDQSVWVAEMDSEQLDHMIVNMGHDAGVAYPEQLNTASLRHTYLTFLVTQGARLNDLEQIAGYVSPSQLSVYRQVNRKTEAVDIAGLTTYVDLK